MERREGAQREGGGRRYGGSVVTWPLVTAATSRPLLLLVGPGPACSTRARQTDGERERARQRDRRETERDRKRKEGRRIQGIGAGEPCCATGKNNNNNNNITMLTVKMRLASPVSLPGQPHTRRSLPGLPSASLGPRPAAREGRSRRPRLGARAGKGSVRWGSVRCGPSRAGERAEERARTRARQPLSPLVLVLIPDPLEVRDELGKQLPGRARWLLSQLDFLFGRFPVCFSALSCTFPSQAGSQAARARSRAASEERNPLLPKLALVQLKLVTPASVGSRPGRTRGERPGECPLPALFAWRCTVLPIHSVQMRPRVWSIPSY